MADIFISYSRADRPWVKDLAAAIEDRGWSVWWDHEISVGKSFRDEIAKQLDSARCVIVVWSSNSVSSNWVHNEASEGYRRGVLIPVILNAAKIPLELRHLQSADLSDWRPNDAHPEFDKVLKSIVERAPLTSASGKTTAPKDKSKQDLESIIEDGKPLSSAPAREGGPVPACVLDQTRPFTPSPALAAIVGSRPIGFSDASDKLFDYINANQPSNQSTEEWLSTDATLRKLFSDTTKFSAFSVHAVVAKNLT